VDGYQDELHGIHHWRRSENTPSTPLGRISLCQMQEPALRDILRLYIE
jgi:hypothetical protein